MMVVVVLLLNSNNNNNRRLSQGCPFPCVVPVCDGLKRLAVRDGWPRSWVVVQLSTTQAGAPVAHALAS